jgi:hypothetical protein
MTQSIILAILPAVSSISLDNKTGYHQIVICPKDQSKLACFGPGHKKYIFTQSIPSLSCLLGLNAPALYTATDGTSFETNGTPSSTFATLLTPLTLATV